jgi:hypothetical protein
MIEREQWLHEGRKLLCEGQEGPFWDKRNVCLDMNHQSELNSVLKNSSLYIKYTSKKEKKIFNNSVQQPRL